MDKLATRTALVCVVLLGAPISSAWAKDRTCGRCGGRQGVHRVCRPVTTIKYEKTNCWDFETEDFCVPRKCKNCCGGCGDAAVAESVNDKHPCPCSTGSCHSGACGYGAVPVSRNRLLKKTFVTRVPVTVWVVEYVCERCACREESAGETPTEKPAGEEASIPKRPVEDPFVDDPSTNIRPADDDEIQMPPAPVFPAPPR